MPPLSTSHPFESVRLLQFSQVVIDAVFRQVEFRSYFRCSYRRMHRQEIQQCFGLSFSLFLSFDPVLIVSPRKGRPVKAGDKDLSDFSKGCIRSVFSRASSPTAFPLLRTQNHSSPAPCLFSIATMEISPALSSARLFLNSMVSSSFIRSLTSSPLYLPLLLHVLRIHNSVFYIFGMSTFPCPVPENLLFFQRPAYFPIINYSELLVWRPPATLPQLKITI